MLLQELQLPDEMITSNVNRKCPLYFVNDFTLYTLTNTMTFQVEQRHILNIYIDFTLDDLQFDDTNDDNPIYKTEAFIEAIQQYGHVIASMKSPHSSQVQLQIPYSFEQTIEDLERYMKTLLQQTFEQSNYIYRRKLIRQHNT